MNSASLYSSLHFLKFQYLIHRKNLPLKHLYDWL
jgi:hypothetical protein